MRKWHRWLVALAGIFLFWIAATGLVGQVISLVGVEHDDGPPPSSVKTAAHTGVGKVGPAPDSHDPAAPRTKQEGPPHDLYHLVIDLHSGNYFGPFGKIISALMGAALLFFSVSGIWMYIEMFRKRRKIGRSGLFWD